jgi:endonuclease/exonuclease/phosphatase family metal-dependent hydrolase
LLTAAVTIGGLLWSGSNRVPVDPTEPLVMLGTGNIPNQSLARHTLRIAAFNIHSGKGLDGRRDLKRIAAHLQAFDLVGLNEVDHEFPFESTDQAAVLGKELKMASLYAPTERRWWHNHFGNGVLSRRAVTACHAIPLPGTQGRKFRNAVLVDVEFRGRTVHLLVTHVDRVQDNQRQLGAVLDLFLALDEPAILMGDLNATRSDPLLERVLAMPDVHDVVAESLPQPPPDDRIDWILARGLRGVAGEFRRSDASDHPLVWAEVELVEGGEE